MRNEYETDEQVRPEEMDPVQAERERYAHPEFFDPEHPPIEVEKSDLPAMMCSAYLVILPACVLAILAICLLGYLFIAR